MTVPSVLFHETASDFLRRAEPLLARDETENHLLWGVARRLARRGPRRLKHFLWTLEHRGEPAAAALWIPPWPLVTTPLDGDCARVLVKILRRGGSTIPGWNAPQSAAEALAAAWREAGGDARLKERLQVRRLEAVRLQEKGPGRLRPAGEGDREFLLSGCAGFHRDTGHPERIPSCEEQVADFLREGRLFLWDDGGPAAMAGWSDPTPHGARVSLVWTAPERRRKGYGASLVAALSRCLLEKGFRWCFLYADADKPSLNALYGGVGYEAYSEWAWWTTSPEGGPIP